MKSDDRLITTWQTTLDALTHQALVHWGISVRLTATQAPLSLDDLTLAEKAYWQQTVSAMHPKRRFSWLLARAALRQLAVMPPEALPLKFPQARLSVTHADQLALAAGCLEGNCLHSKGTDKSQLIGLGIDYEPFRVLRPGAERFFATTTEQALLATLPEAHQTLARLRLWSIKEALYKADPLNTTHRSLRRYVLKDLPVHLNEPDFWQGMVTLPAEHQGAVAQTTFCYLSDGLKDGVLALACCTASPKPIGY